jgi:hypothetical protein
MTWIIMLPLIAIAAAIATIPIFYDSSGPV